MSSTKVPDGVKKKEKLARKTEHKARPYQIEQIHQLLPSVLRNKETLFTAAPGSGKTLTVHAIAAIAIQKAQVTNTPCQILECTPYKDSCDDTKDKYANTTIHIGSGKLKTAPVHVGNIEDQYTTKELLNWLMHRDSNSITLTTHHTIAKLQRLIAPLDVDLTGLIFITDEAHHKSLSLRDATLLGKFCEYVNTHGGTILYVTATPYREYSNRTELIYDPLTIGGIAIRTVGEQMRAKFSPSLEVSYMKMDNCDQFEYGGIYGDLARSRVSGDQLRLYVTRVIKDWKKDGYPKALFLIPSGNSTEDAKIVKEMFEAVKFPHHIKAIRNRAHPRAIISLQDSKELVKLANGDVVNELKADKESNGQYGDVIIGCRQFDEATDVPSLSHIYIIGIPSNTRLFHQRIGRVLRSKFDVNGYAEYFGTQWLETSKVVFMAPVGSDIDNFAYQVSRQIILTMLASESYMHFCDVMNYVSFARVAITGVLNDFSDESDINTGNVLLSQMNSLELEYNANYAETEYSWFEKTLVENPTIGDVYNAIITDTKLSESAKRSKIYALIQNIKCGKDIWTEFADDCVNEYVHKQQKSKKKIISPLKFIDEGFDRIINEFKDTQVKSHITENIHEVYMKLTGETFGAFTKRMITHLGIDNETISVKAYIKFFEANNRNPSPDSSDPEEADLGEWFVKTGVYAREVA